MICALANALAEQQFTTHLVTWDPAEAEAFYPIEASVSWHKFGYQKGIIGKLTRARTLASVLRDEGVDLLIGFAMSGDRTVYTAAKMAQVGLVAAERNGSNMYHMRYNALQRLVSFNLLRLCDGITVQFPAFIAGYPKYLHTRIKMIPNPVWPARKMARPDCPNGENRYQLLAVSRLDRIQKRLDCLIRAFAHIADKHPTWNLLLVGDGPEKTAIIKLAQQFDIIDKLTIKSSTQNIFEVYSGANLFVLPSRWEGFPNALAEAMSHGLPAVGFAGAQGVRDLIKDGVTGWLAPGLDDPSALAHSLDLAMSHDTQRNLRGIKAAEAMRAYDPQTQFDLWVQLIKQIHEKRTS
jgi:GalNAc-alpha-(1->4)-GalNAc-alpha-(1->3)-diNAcBac-PP-undecaprenol alpha-1,4-N-acetyl-D-galactosaminyltransferase